MAVKLRLQRHGRKRRPFYHIVATDSRSRRDGRFIERIGSYNPVTNPATVEIDREKALQWLSNGAQPTDTVKNILSATGVMYQKHLQRGVRKGAFSQEEADRLFQKWADAKAKEAKQRFNFDWTGTGKHAPKAAPVAAPVQQVVEQVAEVVAEVVNEAVETAEEVVSQVTDAAEPDASADDQNNSAE